MSNINSGYADFQLAKALLAPDRNEERIRAWTSVLSNLLDQSVEYGSRTPLRGVPAWATLEVVTGGFATGTLLAGGRSCLSNGTTCPAFLPWKNTTNAWH